MDISYIVLGLLIVYLFLELNYYKHKFKELDSKINKLNFDCCVSKDNEIQYLKCSLDSEKERNNKYLNIIREKDTNNNLIEKRNNESLEIDINVIPQPYDYRNGVN